MNKIENKRGHSPEAYDLQGKLVHNNKGARLVSAE